MSAPRWWQLLILQAVIHVGFWRSWMWLAERSYAGPAHLPPAQEYAAALLLLAGAGLITAAACALAIRDALLRRPAWQAALISVPALFGGWLGGVYLWVALVFLGV